MTPQRWPHGSAAAAPQRRYPGADASPGPPPVIDWPRWLRQTERQRRLVSRRDASFSGNGRQLWARYFLEATDASFQLDGLILPTADLSAALARGWAAKASPRSRQQQRVRNHVAILRRVERILTSGAALKANEVVRWYTSIACGLSIERLDEPTTLRLDAIVHQINSPHLRLAPAVQGIARLHRQMLADPVVPSFNGILARLLLRYHLGRCGLPPVRFVPEFDAAIMADEQWLLARLLERIEETYAFILSKQHR